MAQENAQQHRKLAEVRAQLTASQDLNTQRLGQVCSGSERVGRGVGRGGESEGASERERERELVGARARGRREEGARGGGGARDS